MLALMSLVFLDERLFATTPHTLCPTAPNDDYMYQSATHPGVTTPQPKSFLERRV